jgi:hypothetical protein
VAEVEERLGKRPDPPPFPPEPQFNGNPSEWQAFNRDHQAWNIEAQKLNWTYQREVMQRESFGMEFSQKWDLSPIPELVPFDSRPPEEREWIPVPVFEKAVMQSQKAKRVPTTTRSWRQARGGEWKETLTRGETWRPYPTSELNQVLGDETCIHLPETLIMAVPGESFQSFLYQLEREVLALVRCRWDSEAGEFVQVGSVPQTLVQPSVEIVASLALSELGTLPIREWPGAPSNLHEYLKDCGWELGQQVPVTRAQFAAFEELMSTQSKLPSWYSAPEYRSLMAVNLCWSEALEQWGEEYLWRPLLASTPEDGDWLPTL